MAKLFDADGNEIEAFTKEEVEAIEKSKVELQEQLDALAEGGSTGLKNLREYSKRKEEQLKKLQDELEVLRSGTKEAEKELEKEQEPQKQQKEKINPEELTRKVAMSTYVDIEISRQLSSYSEEERAAIRRIYSKLSAGEDVNLETYQSYLAEAKKLVVPEESSTSLPVSHGGRPARTQSNKKTFDQTDAGKDLAARFGWSFKDKK